MGEGFENGKNGSNANNPSGEHTSPDSHSSHSEAPAPERVAPPRGDYRTLLSFQKAEVVYDLTYRFAKKYLERGDRTVDQMIQAARSGKKNLLEGWMMVKIVAGIFSEPSGIDTRRSSVPLCREPLKSKRGRSELTKPSAGGHIADAVQ